MPTTSKIHQTVLEDFEAIIWQANPATFEFTYVSRSAESLLGYTLEEWLTRKTFWIDTLHPEDRDRAVAECRAAVAQCLDHVFDYRVVAADGRVLWMRDVVSVRCDRGAAVALHGVMIDITDRKGTERTRLEEQSRYSQKMEGLARQTSAIAHDFNNVLTIILGTTDAALATDHCLGARFELMEIRKAAELGATLTRQLLTFSRSASETPEIIDVNETVREVEGLLRRLAGPDVDLALTLSTTAVHVRLGKGMLEQILMNLTVNARDAIADRGTLRIATYNIVTMPGREHAESVIEVMDSGAGMSPEVRARVFEPYLTTKSPGQGTGLGLSTVYGIVRDHGGHIEVDSEVGRGTRFRIHLPIARNRPS